MIIMTNCQKKQHIYPKKKKKKKIVPKILLTFFFITEVFIGIYTGLKYGINPTHSYEEIYVITLWIFELLVEKYLKNLSA